jgi:hypothetical protein
MNGEIKDITRRMEETMSDKSFIDVLVSKVALVKQGKFLLVLILCRNDIEVSAL